MASKIDTAYAAVIDANRQMLARVTTRSGSLERMKKTYEAAQKHLIAKLKALPASSEFSHYQLMSMLHQVKLVQFDLAQRSVPILEAGGIAAAEESLDTLLEGINRMRKAFGKHVPMIRMSEAARFDGIIDPLRPSLLSMHRSSMARYGATLIGKMQDQLAQNMINGDSTDEAIRSISEIADGFGWSNAERIVVTENAYAAGSTASDGMQELAQNPGIGSQLYSRWTEHCQDSDYEGIPLDDRVGDDSIVMHGQCVIPGGMFTMPDDPKAPKSLVGRSWNVTPCRPRGRECLTPYQVEYGGLAWVYDNGGKRFLSTP